MEALTEGARAPRGGRLDARVPVRGNDEVAELGRAFNSMAEALERNERARRSMVSDVAHELRTPLTSIRVQIEAVQDGVMEPDAKWIASIHEDAATLAHLVDDLQQLSLADAGALRLELAGVAVAGIIERALNGRGAEGIAITVNVPADPHPRDARRLVQVVRNLVVNALAFASSSIAISAAASNAASRSASPTTARRPPRTRRTSTASTAPTPPLRTTGGAGLAWPSRPPARRAPRGTICYDAPRSSCASDSFMGSSSVFVYLLQKETTMKVKS